MSESTAQDCGWTAPAAAIDDALAGRIGLLPPTAAAMYQLAAFPDVAGALDGLSREAGDPPPALMPVRGPDGWVLRDTSSGRDNTDPVELGLPPRWRPIPPGLPPGLTVALQGFELPSSGVASSVVPMQAAMVSANCL